MAYTYVYQPISMTIKEFSLSKCMPSNKTHQALTQLGTYMSVGILSTTLDIGTYYIFTRYILSNEDINVVYVKSACFMLGSLCSFYMNRRFTFGVNKDLYIKQISRFYVMVLISLIINTSVFYTCNDLLKIYDLAAAAIALCFSFSAGFTISKLWVFKTE